MSQDNPTSGSVLRLAAVGRLVVPVAHDINNPLTAVLGRIQLHMTRGSAGMPRGPGGLDDIYEQALVISDKVQTLGTLARESIAAAPPTPVVLTDHVAEITQLLGRYIARRGMELHVDIPTTIPPVLVRPVDLKLCIAEVLLAFCGAVRNPAPLHIVAEAQGDKVQLSIIAQGLLPSEVSLAAEGAHLMGIAAADGLTLTVEESFRLSMPVAGPSRPAVALG